MAGISRPAFQFPLHRDPRCNWDGIKTTAEEKCFSSLYIGILAATLPILSSARSMFVSVPFTSGSSLQPGTSKRNLTNGRFQFPLHRDPRCNYTPIQLKILARSFSSLYIGILAATDFVTPLQKQKSPVSVPFTSGSSLQLLTANKKST